MAASSARIDELRKKFDENPRRYFAPLANEYRKAGDLEQAIFICQEYLPQQPGHMSGHIVYGQALFELGRHDEAKTVFETALSLDPENLIALRHLGDIARQAGDPNAARAWYQRVLEADPRNEEIAQIMMTLITSDVVAALPTPAPTDGPTTEGPTNDAATTDASTSDLSASVAAATPIGAAAVPAPPAPEAPLTDASFTEAIFGVEKSQDTVIEVPPPPPPLPPPIPTVAEGQSPHAARDHELLDLDADAFGIGTTAAAPPPLPESGAPPSAAVDARPSSSEAPEPPIDLAADLDIGLPDDGPASTTPAGGDLPLDGLETFESGVVASVSAVTAPALETESFFEAPSVTEAPATEAPAPMETPAAESISSEPPPAEPQQAFLTETMAELYLQQGHLEAALDIYRRLVELRPDETALQKKLDEIERRIFGTTAPPPEPEASVEAPPVATPTSYGGPTIREFLIGLMTRHGGEPPELVAAPADPVETQATHRFDTQAHDGIDGANESAVGDPFAMADLPLGEAPVEEAIYPPPTESRPTSSTAHTVSESLDVFFGGADAAEHDDQAAATLAEAFASEGPETAPLEGLPAHRAANELSLDHVFKSGGAQRASGEHDNVSFDQFFSAESADTAAPAAEDAAGAATESTDDIAQFNAWLNGLKKT